MITYPIKAVFSRYQGRLTGQRDRQDLNLPMIVINDLRIHEKVRYGRMILVHMHSLAPNRLFYQPDIS